jgi:hypothetical protein
MLNKQLCWTTVIRANEFYSWVIGITDFDSTALGGRLKEMFCIDVFACAKMGVDLHDGASLFFGLNLQLYSCNFVFYFFC